MLELKDYDHPYYAEDSNYYSDEAGENFDTASEFLNQYENSDIDMNQVFRWDISQIGEEKNRWSAQIIIIGQRKGLYRPIQIMKIDESELVRMSAYLSKHWENMLKLWNPISNNKEIKDA